MLMALQRYKIKLEFIRGKNNVVADALSRAPEDLIVKDNEIWQRYDVFEVSEEIDVSQELMKISLKKNLQISTDRLKEIQQATNVDIALQKVKDYIRSGWPKYISDVSEVCKIYYKYRDELSIQDDLVFRNDRVVIPFALRKNMVDRVHVAHTGIEATLNLARQNIFWPGMSNQIKQSILSCSTCIEFSKSQQQPPMQSHQTPEYPFQHISMDIFFAEYKGMKGKFLVTVDHYSDFFELDLLPDMSAPTLIEVCKRNFSRHGIPMSVCSDNGTNLENQLMTKLANSWGFQFKTSAPKHQRGNGKAEAAVKIAKKLVKKANKSEQDLWYAVLHWRNTPNKIGSSPNQRIFSRTTRCGIPVTSQSLQPKVIEDVPNKIRSNKMRSKFYYDKKAKALPKLDIGQSVAVQLTPDTDRRWKLAQVKEKVKDRDYLINLSENNKTYRRNQVHIQPFDDNSHLKSQTTLKTNEETATKTCNIQHPQTEPNPKSLSDRLRDCPNESELILRPPVTTNITQIEEKLNTNSEILPTEVKSNQRPSRTIQVPAKYKDFVLY